MATIWMKNQMSYLNKQNNNNKKMKAQKKENDNRALKKTLVLIK